MLSKRGGRGERRIARGVCLLCLWMAAGLLGACERKKEDGAATKQGPAPPPPAVVVAEVLQKTVPVYSEFVAQTDARVTVEVRARVQGILKEMRFKEGDPVKKGEVLYRIEPDEYQANLQAAKAQLAKAEADLESAKAKLGKAQQDVSRYRPLAAARAVPQQDLDTALSSEQVARAEVNQAAAAIQGARATITRAQLDLSYTKIHSPLDGLIGRTKVDVGNLVGKGEATLLNTVSSVDPIRVNFAIPEAEYLRLVSRDPGRPHRQGPPTIELFLADGSAYPHKGQFVLADRAVDLKTGTLNLLAEFPNPTGLIRPGQFGRVRLAADVVNDAILVPQRAIQEIQGAKTVLVVGADDVVALRTITPAESVGEFVIVRDGVKPGERVIVEGVQKARPGIKVHPSAPVSSEPGAKPTEKAPEKNAEAETTEKKKGK